MPSASNVLANRPILEVPNWSSPAKSHLPALDSLEPNHKLLNPNQLHSGAG